jgi:hypothetical protein
MYYYASLPDIRIAREEEEREKQNQYFFTFKIQSEMVDALRECCI